MSASDAAGNVYFVLNAFNGRDTDVQVVKRAMNGANLWSRNWNSGFRDAARQCVTDSDGNLYVVGTVFHPGNSNILMLKYSPDGALQAELQADQGLRDEGLLIRANGREQVAVAGAVHNGTSFDVWVGRLHPRGMLLWQRTHDSGANDYPNDLYINPLGSVEVTFESVTRQAGGGQYTLQSLRLDPNGSRL